MKTMPERRASTSSKMKISMGQGGRENVFYMGKTGLQDAKGDMSGSHENANSVGRAEPADGICSDDRIDFSQSFKNEEGWFLWKGMAVSYSSGYKTEG
ncbi:MULTISPECIES: hypothetical protein [unclassified Akkermansia]|uniref:hypothetical protein n=3 Tax=Akkermansia TaxID=239934 RepID=UPI0013875B54|nr:MULTISPECIES: hypothetical protein [unclassified Akkermansia]